MMRKVVLVMVIALMTVKGYGQITFQKVYGSDSTSNGQNDMVQTIDSGYVLTGKTISGNPASAEILLLKVDKMGKAKWVKRLGIPNYQIVANSIQQTLITNYE